MTDLKPCICGSDKVHFGYEPFCGLTFWRVMCDTCGTQTSTFDTKEEAAEKWNTRPAEDAKDKEIVRLKAALHSVLQNAKFWDNEDDSLAIIHRIATDAIGKDTDVPANAPDTGKMEEKER